MFIHRDYLETRPENITVQTFPIPTSEFEGSGLVLYKFSETDGYRADLHVEISLNAERFLRINFRLEPCIPLFLVVLTSPVHSS